MILRRYMTQQVATTTALVVTFLVILLLGGRIIRYFGIAAEGRLDVGLLFTIIGYNVPYFLELILPLSFFIGLMLVFGRLYVDSEMAVLNASGVSRGRLARLMTPLILVLFIMEAGLSLFGKPWGVKQADTLWQQQSLNSAFDLIRPQSFISSDDYHLYVGSMSKDRTELQDVILVQTVESEKNRDTLLQGDVAKNGVDIDIASLDDADATNDSLNTADDQSTISNEVLETITSPVVSKSIDSNHTESDNKAKNSNAIQQTTKDVIVLAKRAKQVQGVDNSDKTQLDLYQGRRYEIDANSKAYNQVSFERYRISINTPSADSVTEDNVETQTLPVLWRSATAQPLADNAVNQKEHTQQLLPAQAELGYRFTLPWLMIIAPMLAVPLAQVRPRQGRWLRLIPAILIFTSCALVMISLKKPIAKGTMTVWVYPIAILAFMILALYFNWASRIHHRVRFGLGVKNKEVS